MLSVKTAKPIPKDKIMDVVQALRPVTVTAPVHVGDVVAGDILGTGVDIVATRPVAAI
jgi:CxxC motif-containing protein